MDEFERSRIRDLGAEFGFTIGSSEAERYACAIDEEFRGHERLDEIAAPRSFDDAVRDVVFGPGSDIDPLNAFTSLFSHPETAGPLSDLEIAIKDNFAVAGAPMTCGSRVFESVIPTSHATVVSRLLAAGATIRGKTNMDELAYGPTSETSGFGPVSNPEAHEHVAGGSSSGSGAAVGNNTVDAALGSDTGGSVRIPAAFCGIVGFKPTWGAIPRTGMVELAYTLDHVGPIARDLRTAARVFDAIVGPDPGDFSSARATRLVGSAADAVEAPPAVEKLSFGLVHELFGSHVDEPVENCVRSTIDDLEGAGATVSKVSIPDIEECVHIWNTITNAEFADTLRSGLVPVRRREALDIGWQDAAAAALQAGADELGVVARRKAIVGAKILENSRSYVRARFSADALYEQFETALSDHDVLISPTMPVTAPGLGTWTPDTYSTASDSYDVPLAYNTRPANLAGIPAMTLPCGRADELPVGLQLIGEEYGDLELFAAAAAVEQHV
ncbi:amidase [Natronorarus salvus]|uniref:amidase n=1 Tax=Natronorarus salvus TaxID=3117733 RepID=UPI002F261B82